MFASANSSHQVPSSLQLLTDWLETDTTANPVSELSPSNSLSDLPDVIPEHDEYRAMPHSLRHVLVPPPLDASRPRSILLEPTMSYSSTSLYSRPRWSPTSDSTNGGVSRARQSVSSIGSCSTVPYPVKSILTRHDSGVSMATTTKSTRRKKKRSPPSVKFVDAPTLHRDDGVYYNAPPPRSPPSPESPKPVRWFARWWKRSTTPRPRPLISGPYHLSYAASLVDVYSPAPSTPKPSRLGRLWHRLTSAIS